MKTVYAVGLGPGSLALLTPEAREVIGHCDTIAGYKTYLDQIPELLSGKRIVANGMRQEVDRCRAALEAANAGAEVAVVSSGDAGIYGMAGLLLELAESEEFRGIEIRVVPGVTAASAAAALVGAPLMCDFCVISLSDLLADRTVIQRRIRAAAENDFVTALYNPGSTKRRDVARPGERFSIGKISEFPFEEIDMTTIVILGCSRTVVRNGRMYTLRGYQEKYGGFRQ